jgi:predicted transcriptional regulator of viral defense system
MRAALDRLQAARRIVRPLRKSGFFVIVPPEFRTIGAPPLTWYLDGLMRFMEVPDYYVGLLTAAEWHGASHYAVQETQVVVSRQFRPITVGRERIRFVRKAAAGMVPVEERLAEGGRVCLSTPEATAYDLVRYARVSGGSSLVATAVAELKLRPGDMKAVLDAGGETPVVQRLGYFLEHGGHDASARAVERWLQRRRRVRVSALVPSAPLRGAEFSERWKLLVNADVQAAA